jgi:hypothetical protein
LFRKHEKIEKIMYSSIKYIIFYYLKNGVLNYQGFKGTPIITKSSTKPYTGIEFAPDLDRFGIDKIDEDTLMLMKKRVLDITACTNKNVSAFNKTLYLVL